MRKTTRYFTAAIAALALFTAAPLHAQEADAEENDAASGVEAELLQIGQEPEEGDYIVALTNSTGKDITSVTVQVDEEEPTDNLLAEGSVFENEAQAQLVITPAEIKEGQTKAPRYNLELTFADGLTAALHTFPFGDADSAVILLDELSADQLDEAAEGEDALDADAAVEIAYIRFTSKSLGSEQDTRWHEWDAVAPGKAEEAAAAYAAKQAAAQAAAQAASAPAYWADDTDSSYNYTYDASTAGGGAGNTEQCLNGGMLN